MKIFETVSSTREHIHALTDKHKRIGFVPTMGALHEGHLSLVSRAAIENDNVVVSIFVNPIQFNNPDDLEKYPRDLEADVRLLQPYLKDDDIIFAPSPAEMYPRPETHQYDFGTLANVMEGRFRPGHFNGVGVVVNKLFRIVEPQTAYFGEKDFQQLAIIKCLTVIEELPVQIIPCEIVREPDGLAMSSRNVRLTTDYRSIAPMIYQAISHAAANIDLGTPLELKKIIAKTLNRTGLEVEYVEFADETSLQPVKRWNESDNIRCFIAVQAGEIRLIDNVKCPKQFGR